MYSPTRYNRSDGATPEHQSFTPVRRSGTARKPGQEAPAVPDHIGGRYGACGLQYGWRRIDVGRETVDPGTGHDTALPSQDGRNAASCLAGGFPPRPMAAGTDHHGIARRALVLQLPQDGADAAVDPGRQGVACIDAGRFDPFQHIVSWRLYLWNLAEHSGGRTQRIFTDPVRGVRAVGFRLWHGKKKRFVRRFTDEFQGPLRNPFKIAGLHPPGQSRLPLVLETDAPDKIQSRSFFQAGDPALIRFNNLPLYLPDIRIRIRSQSPGDGAGSAIAPLAHKVGF